MGLWSSVYESRERDIIGDVNEGAVLNEEANDCYPCAVGHLVQAVGVMYSVSWGSVNGRVGECSQAGRGVFTGGWGGVHRRGGEG